MMAQFGYRLIVIEMKTSQGRNVSDFDTTLSFGVTNRGRAAGRAMGRVQERAMGRVIRSPWCSADSC
jgi:hypothetical protein